MSYKIYIDAGHGGYDNGATYNGRKEKDDNMKLAKAVVDLLREKGIDAEFIRASDIYQSPGEKAQIANDNNADLLVSLHRSSSPVPNTYEGVESYIFNKGDAKEKIANNINANLEKLGFKNLGVDVRKNLALLKKTKMPAIIVDVGFINTNSDNELFDSSLDKIAAAIASAIESSLPGETVSIPEVDYSVQVGLFRNIDNAYNLQNILMEKGINARIQAMGGLYAVLVGKYRTVAEAVKQEEQLNNMGYNTIVVEE